MFKDLHTINLNEFKYGGTNITAFRIVDPDSIHVQETVNNWIASEQQAGRKPNLLPDTNTTTINVFPIINLMSKDFLNCNLI